MSHIVIFMWFLLTEIFKVSKMVHFQENVAILSVLSNHAGVLWTDNAPAFCWRHVNGFCIVVRDFYFSKFRASYDAVGAFFQVNVLALCICTREAVKSMQERGVDDGHIININRYQIFVFASWKLGCFLMRAVVVWTREGVMQFMSSTLNEKLSQTAILQT